jgi:hypothetical protein
MTSLIPATPPSWKQHVETTPIGFIPIMVGNLPAFQSAAGMSSAQLLTFFERIAPERHWPQWLRENAKQLRRQRRQEKCAAKRYLPDTRKQDVGR